MPKTPESVTDVSPAKNSTSPVEGKTTPANPTDGTTDFDELLTLVMADTKLLDTLTDDQISELRKKINPYGRTIEGQGKYTCLSITNLSEEYMKKMLMTSLIGFLYNQCDEYLLSDSVPISSMDDYKSFMETYNKLQTAAEMSREWLYNFKKDHKGVDLSANDNGLTISEKAQVLDNKRTIEMAESATKRLIIRQFLDSLFQFNPDKHVKSAYSNNPLDPERVQPAQVANKKKTKRVVKGRNGKTLVLKDKPDTKTAESKKTTEPTKTAGTAGTSRTAEPKKTTETAETESRSNSKFVKHIPPADTFHRWSYYTDVNYEEIRTAVTDLYAVKPDLEFAINPYSQFDSDEKASNFVQKHRNEVIADIITLTNGKWNLCGSFKKNRERVSFYNTNTAVIEEICKQIETDKKLGAELMRKRVRRKKLKNREECGDDPAEFKEYKRTNPSAFENMGAEDVSRENKSDIKKDDVTFKVHEECPYDAVQVDIFNISKGGLDVKKTEIFTEAEEPKKLN